MSYTVTGIQSVLASFSFPGTDHASGGTSLPEHAKATTDPGNGAGLSSTDTVKLSSPDKIKVQSSTSATAAPSVASTAAPVDTVTLSAVDKVRNLRREGEGDTQIASTLNLPLKEVQSDLHLETQTHQSFTVAPVVSSLSIESAST